MSLYRERQTEKERESELHLPLSIEDAQLVQHDDAEDAAKEEQQQQHDAGGGTTAPTPEWPEQQRRQQEELHIHGQIPGVTKALLQQETKEVYCNNLVKDLGLFPKVYIHLYSCTYDAREETLSLFCMLSIILSLYICLRVLIYLYMYILVQSGDITKLGSFCRRDKVSLLFLELALAMVIL